MRKISIIFIISKKKYKLVKPKIMKKLIFFLFIGISIIATAQEGIPDIVSHRFLAPQYFIYPIHFGDYLNVNFPNASSSFGVAKFSSNGGRQLVLEDIDAANGKNPFWYMQSANNGSKGILYLGCANRATTTGYLIQGTDMMLLDSASITLGSVIGTGSIPLYSGAITSPGLLTLSGTTGINLTGALTKGINFGNASLVGSATYENSAFAFGTNSVAVNTTALAGHYVPIQVCINSNASAAYDVAATRLKITTDASTPPTLANHTVLQLRGTINGNAGSFTGLSSSVNVAQATTLGAIGMGAGYFNIQGSGAITSATSGAYVLLATSTHTSTGVTDVGAFTLNASGGVISNIVHVDNTIGTTTDMVKIANTGGTATNGIDITGTYSGNAIYTTGTINGLTVANGVSGLVTVATAAVHTDSAVCASCKMTLAVNKFVTITSANILYIVQLPVASTNFIGGEVKGFVGSNGCKLRLASTDETAGTVYLNNATGNKHIALAANSFFIARQVSATQWIVTGTDIAGTVLSVTPASF